MPKATKFDKFFNVDINLHCAYLQFRHYHYMLTKYNQITIIQQVLFHAKLSTLYDKAQRERSESAV